MNGRIQRFTREKGGEKGGKSGFFLLLLIWFLSSRKWERDLYGRETYVF